MRILKKVAVVSAAAALAVPGVAQASHDSGKAGAPGQVCKPLKAAQVKAAKGVKGKQRAALNKTYKAAYKACIQAAAKARSADQPKGPSETTPAPEMKPAA